MDVMVCVIITYRYHGRITLIKKKGASAVQVCWILEKEYHFQELRVQGFHRVQMKNKLLILFCFFFHFVLCIFNKCYKVKFDWGEDTMCEGGGQLIET